MPPLRRQHAVAGRFTRASVRVHVLPRGAPHRIVCRRFRRLGRPPRPRRRGDARRGPDRRRPANAPRFRGGRRVARGGVPAVPRPLAIPLDLSVRELTCGGWAPSTRERAASRRERFALDMQRQSAGNEALARVRAEGVICGRCGASNAVPGRRGGAVPCASCKAPILSQTTSTPARSLGRAWRTACAGCAEALLRHAARNRLVLKIALGAVVVVALALALVRLLARS